MANEQQVVSDEVQRLLLSEIIWHMAPMNVVAIHTNESVEYDECPPSLCIHAKYLGERVEWDRERRFHLFQALWSKLEELGEMRYPIIQFDPVKQTKAKEDCPALQCTPERRETHSRRGAIDGIHRTFRYARTEFADLVGKMASEQQAVSEKVQHLLLYEIRNHLAPMNVVTIHTEQWGEGWETGPSLWVYAGFVGEEEEWGGEKYLRLMDVLPSKLEECGETRRPVVLFERIKEIEDAVD